jgi:diacylglycerol diphosphate phosphatase/phosphatidate phosphatase
MIADYRLGSMKNAIGKPRPDLIDRCQPAPGSVDPLPFGLSNSTICTQKDAAILKDGFRSFPSGHSSSEFPVSRAVNALKTNTVLASFGGLFYLSLYLAGKLHVLDSRGEVWKMFVVLIPSLGAALVAGSRIMDARHHPFDVLSGSTIGILIGWVAYRQYFPPLSDFHAKGRAYSIVSHQALIRKTNANLGQRTWGKDRAAIRPEDTISGYEATRVDTEQPATFIPAESSPEIGGGSTGNHFRDEIAKSQRERRQRSQRTGPSGSTVPGRNEPPWEELPDEEEGYELQPQYTLSNPNTSGAGYYDSFGADLANQGTAYHSQTSPAANSPPKPMPSISGSRSAVRPGDVTPPS